MNNIAKSKKIALSVIYGIFAAISIFGTAVCAISHVNAALLYIAPLLPAVIITVIQAVIVKKKGLLGGAGIANIVLAAVKFVITYIVSTISIIVVLGVMIGASRGGNATLEGLMTAVACLSIPNFSIVPLAIVALEENALVTARKEMMLKPDSENS